VIVTLALSGGQTRVKFMGDLFEPLPPVADPDTIIFNADCLDVLRSMPAACLDGVVTDPPYHLTSIVQRYSRTSLDGSGTNEARARDPSPADGYARLSRGFMGKVWDGGDIAFRPETWSEFLRVMKPGAHLVAFGGTRTFHRMVTAIEDAGFEIRDRIRYETSSKFAALFDSLSPDQVGAVLEWLHDIEGGSELAWQFGSGMNKQGGLRPAFEPIVIARAPLIGSRRENVEAFGIGRYFIDQCKTFVDGENTARVYRSAKLKPGADQDGNGWRQDGVYFEGSTENGRLPCTVITDGTLDEFYPSAVGQVSASMVGNVVRNTYFAGETKTVHQPRGDRNRSAARFFYQAKATASDRNGSTHPTVKPINLVRWLIRLIVPKGALILDGFAGSGTTIAAARSEGVRIIAIEREPQHFIDCKRRVESEHSTRTT
jgi:DNA modification methylase